ncbi:MAG: hypothetical protein QF412_12250, partial [Planctomycetota bacterium]|nr:hypothetical protein [Planctomycetota bacterium]
MRIPLLVVFAFLVGCAGHQQTQSAGTSSTLANAAVEKKEGKSQTPDGAQEWRWKTWADENGNVPENAMMKAVEQREQAVALEFDNGGIQPGTWRWLGPGNVGGRSRSLWIQPSNANVLVLGSVGGGIWRSTDAGASWNAVNDFPASLAICCITGAPGSSYTMYAGTGEGFGSSRMFQQGAGIYKSADSGKTWTRLTSTANSNFNYVNRIAIPKSSWSTILAATTRGLFRSTNSGASWTKVLSGRLKDVEYHPTNGNLAVAGKDNQAYYSTTAGATWTAATGIGSGNGRVELAYAKSKPSIVYASTANVSGGNSGIYRSSDGGKTYTLRNSSINLVFGWYANIIWVDPTNSNLIVVGGQSLYRSTNGGTSFTNISGVHADQHMVLEHPGYNGSSNKTVYVCNDGGIYRTSNITTATNKSGWTNLNNRIGITQFYGGAVSPNGTPVGGTQDNGTQQITNR